MNQMLRYTLRCKLGRMAQGGRQATDASFLLGQCPPLSSCTSTASRRVASGIVSQLSHVAIVYPIGIDLRFGPHQTGTRVNSDNEKDKRNEDEPQTLPPAESTRAPAPLRKFDAFESDFLLVRDDH